MLDCPKCGNESRVTETRNLGLRTRRRRVCVSIECNFKFSTAETIVATRKGMRLDKGLVLVRRADLVRLEQAVAAIRSANIAET